MRRRSSRHGRKYTSAVRRTLLAGKTCAALEVWRWCHVDGGTTCSTFSAYLHTLHGRSSLTSSAQPHGTPCTPRPLSHRLPSRRIHPSSRHPSHTLVPRDRVLLRCSSETICIRSGDLTTDMTSELHILWLDALAPGVNRLGVGIPEQVHEVVLTCLL